MEQYIYSLLSNNATLLGNVGTRIYPTELEVNTQLPAIGYYIESSIPTIYLNGASPLTEYALTVEIVALNFDTLRTIGDAVITQLHGYRGFPTIQGAFLRQRTTEQGQDDNGQNFHRMIQNYTVFG